MTNLWSEAEARDKDEMELLVYQSRLIGSDSSLVVWGGGNTSIKTTSTDFLGKEVSAMAVKGSGSDLKSIEAKHFPSLKLNDVMMLFDRDDMSDDEMVAYLAQCMLDPKSPRPSIETLLHAFLPYHSVVHSHADSIVALTNTRESNDVLRDVYGDTATIVEYMRPGFALSKLVGTEVRNNPSSNGVVLVNHGLFTWGGSSREAYDKHIDLVMKAEHYIDDKSKGRVIFDLKPTVIVAEPRRRQIAAALSSSLRGMVSCSQKMVIRYDDSPDVLEFVNSVEGKDLSQIGPATPDHTLQTKIKPMWVDMENFEDLEVMKENLQDSVQLYVANYTAWYCSNTDGNHPMLDPYPRVILIPGLGMWSTGKDAKSAFIAGDVYHHTIRVIKSAQGVGQFTSLTDKDAYHVEYWPMELYKLTLAPPERELSRKVVMITGAAHGIGKAIAWRMAGEGAHVVITDIDHPEAMMVAGNINEKHGFGRAIAFEMDVRNPDQIASVFHDIRLAYGGLDILVSNAGIAPVGALHELSLEDWQRALDVNTTGHFLVAREVITLMRDQDMGGSLVFVGTKNVTSPGKDFGAYSASKAAEVQMARVLAIENGEYGIRVNIVNPDAVFEGSRLWSQDLKEKRAKAHGIYVKDLESFYQERNLLKERVTLDDVAEAVMFLAGPRSSKTTGAMLPVDAGVKDAFPR